MGGSVLVLGVEFGLGLEPGLELGFSVVVTVRIRVGVTLKVGVRIRVMVDVKVGVNIRVGVRVKCFVVTGRHRSVLCEQQRCGRLGSGLGSGSQWQMNTLFTSTTNPFTLPLALTPAHYIALALALAIALALPQVH